MNKRNELFFSFFIFVQGLLIIGLIIYLWRKRKSETGRKQFQDSQREHHTNHIDEPVEVDWDQLENKYLEMPSSRFNSYPPSANFNDEGTTLRSTEDIPIVSTTTNFVTVVPGGNENHRLNTAEAVSQKQHHVMVLKPHGAGFH